MSLSTARHTQAGRRGVIEEARLRFMGEQVAAEQEAGLEERCVQIQTQGTEGGQASTAGGVVGIWGALELPDALALEAAIARGAKALKDLGSSESLDVRRSWALGDLARTGGPGLSDPSSWFASASAAGRDLDLGGRSFLPECACALGFSASGRGGREGKVMMYLHLTPDAFHIPETEAARDPSIPEASTPEVSSREVVWDAGGGGAAREGQPGSDMPPSSPSWSMEGSSGTAVSTSGGGVVGEASRVGVVRVEGAGIGAGMAMSTGVVRSWFTRPRLGAGVKVIFRPVVDLADHQHAEAYEVPERLKEHAGLRDGACVFPWCHRAADRSDCDHIIPWRPEARGGPTCTCNLAPLCRFHHRAKTHADNHIGNAYTWWNYESLGEGKYLWKGPKGSRLLRTNHGVYDLVTTSTPDNNAGTSDPASADGQGQIDKGVHAAQIVVNHITATLPNADTDVNDDADEEIDAGAEGVGGEAESARGQVGNGEKFTGAAMGAFTGPGGKKRSWREMAPTIEFDHDRPNVTPGTLAHRVINRELLLPTPLEQGLTHLRTEFELFATPQQRAKAKFHAEYRKRTGRLLPQPVLTTIEGIQFVHKSPWPTRLTPAPRPAKKRRTKWKPPTRWTEK